MRQLKRALYLRETPKADIIAPVGREKTGDFVRQNILKNGIVARSARSKAYRFVGLQAAVVMILSLSWGLAGDMAVLSAALGGLTCILPNLYFARRFFASANHKEAHRIVRAFYVGELVKLLLSTVLIVLILKVVSVRIVPFLTGYIGAHMGFWLAPFLAVIEARVKS